MSTRAYARLSIPIAAGDSLSGSINLRQAFSDKGNMMHPDLRVYGIFVPSGWTAAKLSFLMKAAESDVFGDVFDDTNTEYAITVTAGKFVIVNHEVFASAPFLQIRSGVTALPVNQVSAVNLILSLREW